MIAAMRPRRSWRSIVLCGLCLAISYAALCAWLYPSYPPSQVGTIQQKMDAYAAQRDRIDLVWLGDSRTFCAMHPEVYDPCSGCARATSPTGLSGSPPSSVSSRT